MILNVIHKEFLIATFSVCFTSLTKSPKIRIHPSSRQFYKNRLEFLFKIPCTSENILCKLFASRQCCYLFASKNGPFFGSLIADVNTVTSQKTRLFIESKPMLNRIHGFTNTNVKVQNKPQMVLVIVQNRFYMFLSNEITEFVEVNQHGTLILRYVDFCGIYFCG